MEYDIDVQAWGTPELLGDKLRTRGEKFGDYSFRISAKTGAIAPAEARRSVA